MKLDNHQERIKYARHGVGADAVKICVKWTDDAVNQNPALT